MTKKNYKKLFQSISSIACRHYWELDKVATAYHVNAYREMWDSEEEEKVVLPKRKKGGKK